MFWLGIVLLLSGVVVNFIYQNDFLLRSVGLLLLVVGVLVMRASNVRGLMGLRDNNDSYATSRGSNRPGPLAWAASLASVAGLVISYILMFQDDRAGGHEVWTVYAVGICGFVAALTCSYLVTKFFNF